MSGKVVHVLSGQDYDVYVGRAMPRYGLVASVFANRHKMTTHCGRDCVLGRFERGARMKIKEDLEHEARWGIASEYLLSLRALKDRTLACWCAPQDGHLTTDDETVCHAQILLRLSGEVS